MSEREEVLKEFGTAECVKRDDCTHFDCVAERKMAEEIVRLRSQLAAAQRERDEARRERDALKVSAAEDMPVAVKNISEIIGENHALRAQLTAMTEARDLWQSEARIQQAHRERAEREREAYQSDAYRFAEEARVANDRAERVVEAARPWLADMWRGDLNGTAIGVCMEYEPNGQYVLWEQVAPIVEAISALDAHHASEEKPRSAG